MEETRRQQRKRKSSIAMQVLTIKKKSEKVGNIVATFLNNDSDDFQVPTIKVELEKVTNMVGTFLNKDSMGSLFKRPIGYNYQLVVLKSVKISTSSDIQKGYQYGGNLFERERYRKPVQKSDGYSYQKVVSDCLKVRATKTESEKVTNMVGTF